MRHLVVTGGAEGIGQALAERFARAGFTATIVDLQRPRAEATAAAIGARGGHANVIHADLTTAEGVTHVLRCLADLPPIDVFINNAGISAVGRFETLDRAQMAAVLALNLHAPLALSAGILANHLLAPAASLVFISSLSYFTGYPGAAAYAASKDGLAAYARSLRAALRGRGIAVLTVFPGPTRTAHARRYSPDNRREARRMPPELLAERIFCATIARQPILLPSASAHAFALVGRFAPALAEAAMDATIYRKLP